MSFTPMRNMNDSEVQGIIIIIRGVIIKRHSKYLLTFVCALHTSLYIIIVYLLVFLASDADCCSSWWPRVEILDQQEVY